MSWIAKISPNFHKKNENFGIFFQKHIEKLDFMCYNYIIKWFDTKVKQISEGKNE